MIDVVRNGTATAPVALTLSTLNLMGNATANFTGTALGVSGVNTSRIVIPAHDCRVPECAIPRRQ